MIQGATLETTFAVALAVAICGSPGLSQSAPIEVEEPILVSAGIDYPLAEPHLIVNPTDPDHLLTAAITFLELEGRSSGRPTSHITLFQSHDGGRNWEALAFDDGIDIGADPWLAMNDRGVVILTALNGIRGEDRGVFMLALVSPDGGRSWGAPTNLGRDHDRPTIAIHPSTQEFVIVSAKGDRNAEGNARWGISTIRLEPLGVFGRSSLHFASSVDQNTMQPVFTDEGDLFVPFIDYMAQEELLETRRAWIVRSSDRGASYSEPVLITEQKWGPAHLAIDRGGSHPGRLYYLLERGGRQEHVGFTLHYSDDRGESWSSGVDVARMPGPAPDMRNPALAVNRQGVVAVTWYDRRDDPAGARQDLYATVSVDGGESFLEEVRVSDWSSDPLTEANGSVAERLPAGGHYHGLAALPDGSFQIVWAASPDGVFRLYTTRIRIPSR